MENRGTALQILIFLTLMILLPTKSTLEVITGIMVNLTSGWFGVLLISPGLFGVSPTEYLRLLLFNLPFGIVSLVVTIWLSERAKSI